MVQVRREKCSPHLSEQCCDSLSGVVVRRVDPHNSDEADEVRQLFGDVLGAKGGQLLEGFFQDGEESEV